MRKFILLIFSGAMLAVGAYDCIFQMLFAPVVYYRLAFAGAILALLGRYLIWTDFVAPRLGISTLED